MTENKIVRLRDKPDSINKMAKWFHKKWGIPTEAYLQSMNECLMKQYSVPQWYIMLDNGKIIAGLGIIKNDFHDRLDLSPNVCAVYVEETYRNQGIAGKLLDFACRDMKNQGIETLYLLTDHTSFYERYGWEFLCMVQGDGEPEMSRMYIHHTK